MMWAIFNIFGQVTNSNANMKALSVIISIVLVSSSFISPQDIEVEEIKEKMEKGKEPGIEVTIPFSKRNYIKRQWKRHLRNYDNDNLNKKRKKVLADNIVIPSIRDFPLNIYTHLKGIDEDVRMRVFFQTGEDQFMENGDKGYQNAKDFIKSFAAAKTEEALNDKLGNMEDKLDDKKDDLESLEDDAEDLKETIKEAKEDLQKNRKKQKRQQKKIEQQKQVVNELENRIDDIDQ